MSTHKQPEGPHTSGRRTFLNIVLFMIGTIVILLAVKFFFGM
jgi:hypothetical protein